MSARRNASMCLLGYLSYPFWVLYYSTCMSMTWLKDSQLDLGPINMRTMLRFILSANHLSFTTVKQKRRFRWNSCPSGHRKVTWGSHLRGLRYWYGSFNYPHDTNLWTRRILHQSLYKWKGILRVSSFCYLGTEVHENFNWMTEVNSSCYGTLYWRSWITLTLIMAENAQSVLFCQRSITVSLSVILYQFILLWDLKYYS